MRMKFWLRTLPWVPVYDDDPPNPDGGDGGEGEGDGKKDPPNPDEDKPTISQKKLNSIIAEEKRKYQKQLETQVAQLEQLKKSKGLSDKEKTELQTRIEELNNSMLSKEQLAQKEAEKLKNEHKKQLETVTTERDTWKNRYTASTIQRGILDEAVKADAYSPAQLVRLLETQTRLAEELDGEGNPTGNFIPKVKFNDVDKEGKPVTLDLTVAEAVKRMKDIPDYANLFKSSLQAGLGKAGGTGGSTDKGPPSDPEQYRKWREQQKQRGKKS